MKYAKMTGSGNDFIIVNNMDRRLNVADIAPLVPKICARGVSIGADGFFMIEPADTKDVDFKWHFYNSDGTTGEMCGNGSRCVARFVHRLGYVGKNMRFLTGAGVIAAEIIDETHVKVQLTTPHSLVIDKTLDAGSRQIKYSYVNTGVPHAVLFVDDVESADVAGLGRLLRYHSAFAPAGANVDFVKMVAPDILRMRTYERGVEGETLACGTGAVASALIAIEKGLVKSPVHIKTSGNIDMNVYMVNGTPYLEGEARLLSEGEMFSEAMKY
ncbi:diaminopimelate epimerase [Deferribacterales bacterium RsTz2092]|nr:diaminopimelate epimerase [Deferribacterales bacterium]GHU88159.1 diaminopimelate epimerase [Deferribacterales bacterium]